VLGAMPDDERAEFEAHLTTCAVCQAEIDELAVAVEALPTSAPAMVPPPALKARIMAEVEREAALLASAGTPRQEAKPRRRWRFAFPTGAVAALACGALLVGLAAGALLFGGAGTRNVPFQGTDAAVSAQLQIEGGTGTIVAKHLPPAPDGKTYMVWLVPKGSSTPEPTSTLFTPRSDGSATASVTGVDDASTVIINTEPPGGSDKPTSDPVLTASLT
jgi:anti-sigma-K factor RskA